MLSTFSFFCCLGRCNRNARCPKNDSGFQWTCKANCDHLRCPSCPSTMPTFKGEASNRDAKELVVRRMIGSSNLCQISRCQMSVRFFCNICLYPRQKLGSLREGLAKKAWITAAWHRDPNIDRNIFSSITLKITTRLGCRRVDAPTLPGSRKLQ